MYPMYDVPSVGPWIDVLVSALAVGVGVCTPAVVGNIVEELLKKANRGFAPRAVVVASVFCGLIAIPVQVFSPSELVTTPQLHALVQISRLGFAGHLMIVTSSARSLGIADYVVLVFGANAVFFLGMIVLTLVTS